MNALTRMDGMTWTGPRRAICWAMALVLMLALVTTLQACRTVSACNNGKDNDGDGLFDFPLDPGCSSARDNFELDYRPGDLFVSDIGDWLGNGAAIWHVDAETRRATPIVRGEPLVRPSGLVLDEAGRLYFADQAAMAVFRLDLETGALTTVSSQGLLRRPSGLAQRPGGTLVVADPNRDALIAIDPETGEQSIELSVKNSRTVITGSSGELIYASDFLQGVYSADPCSEANDLVAEGPDLTMVWTLIRDQATGLLLASDNLTGQIVEIDPSEGCCGNYTVLETDAGPLPALRGRGFDQLPDGNLVLADLNKGTLWHVDRSTIPAVRSEFTPERPFWSPAHVLAVPRLRSGWLPDASGQPRWASFGIQDDYVLYEGDIAFSLAQVHVLAQEKEEARCEPIPLSNVIASNAEEATYSSVIDRNHFTAEKPIPYFIDDALRSRQLDGEVRRAVGEWETHTPYKFTEIAEFPEKTCNGGTSWCDPIVVFRYQYGGLCNATVGIQVDGDGGSGVNVHEGCLGGGYEHELGHSLGFWHIQDRSDREGYMYSNAKPGDLWDWGEYNFRSFMHYSTGGDEFFSVVPLPGGVVGQAHGYEFTKADIAAATVMANDEVDALTGYDSLSERWLRGFAPNAADVAAGDFDGDGGADVSAFVRGASGEVQIAYSEYRGWPGVRNYAGICLDDSVCSAGLCGDFQRCGICLDGEICAAGNVDGDEYTDIVAFNQTSGRAWVSLSTGDGFEPRVLWHEQIPSFGNSFELVDVDGDGLDDAVVFSMLDNELFVEVARSNGLRFGIPGARFGLWFSSYGRYGRLGDPDDDGRAELVSVDWSSGDVYVHDAVIDYTKWNTPLVFESAGERWAEGYCGLPANCMLGDMDGKNGDDLVALEEDGFHHVSYSIPGGENVEGDFGHSLDRVRIAVSRRSFFSEEPTFHEIDCRSNGCILADVDGDGDADLVDWVDEPSTYREVGDLLLSVNTGLWVDDEPSMHVHLQANNGQYVVAEGGGGGDVNADRYLAREWETFALFDTNGGALESGDPVHLRTNGRFYLMAVDWGGKWVEAAATYPLGWETFFIERVGGGSGPIVSRTLVSLRAGNGQYVVAEGGGGAVNANRDVVQAWETFELIEAP